MSDVYTAADWITALLATVALTMVALGPRDIEVARGIFGIAAFLTILRWEMWSFTTDSPWYARALVGAMLGATSLGGVPAFWQWARIREANQANVPADQASRIESDAKTAPLTYSPPTKIKVELVIDEVSDDNGLFHLNVTNMGETDTIITSVHIRGGELVTRERSRFLSRPLQAGSTISINGLPVNGLMKTRAMSVAVEYEEGSKNN